MQQNCPQHRQWGKRAIRTKWERGNEQRLRKRARAMWANWFFLFIFWFFLSSFSLSLTLSRSSLLSFISPQQCHGFLHSWVLSSRFHCLFASGRESINVFSGNKHSWVQNFHSECLRKKKSFNFCTNFNYEKIFSTSTEAKMLFDTFTTYENKILRHLPTTQPSIHLSRNKNISVVYIYSSIPIHPDKDCQSINQSTQNVRNVEVVSQ